MSFSDLITHALHFRAEWRQVTRQSNSPVLSNAPLTASISTAVVFKHDKDRWDTHLGLFITSSVCLQLWNHVIFQLPSPFPWFNNLSPSLSLPRWLWQRDYCRICLPIKWFTPLEWMPEVTSCPTSCRIMLAECSAGKPQKEEWTRIKSSTSSGTTATDWTLTSPSTHTCWPQASWQRGGMAAWRAPRSALLHSPGATSLVKCEMVLLWKETQP